MSPANPNMERHSTNHVNPDNPIFQREPVVMPRNVSIGQAAAVQTGIAPEPTTQSPLLNEGVEPSPAAPSAEDLDAVAAEQEIAQDTAPVDPDPELPPADPEPPL